MNDFFFDHLKSELQQQLALRHSVAFSKEFRPSGNEERKISVSNCLHI